MQFTQLTLVVDSANVKFNPYERGASEAFVFRKDGVTLHAPRLIVSTKVDDTSSDKYTVQLNEPRVQTVDGIDKAVGSDLVKTELRFLATTSEAARKAQIDTQIVALQQLRDMIGKREKMYS